MIKREIAVVEQKYFGANEIAKSEFHVGDTVDVHVKIKEGDKERIQIFNGVVISRHGRGGSETFTVRRIVNEEGVERTWPLMCPAVTKIDVRRRGKVRRAKLYFLRDRKGKATKVRELRAGKEEAAATEAAK